MEITTPHNIDLKEQLDITLLLHANSFDEESDKLTVNLPFELLRNPEQSLICYAKDDNLAHLGIHRGDMLIVDNKLKPNHQDIVCIQLDESLSCHVLNSKQAYLHNGQEEEKLVLSEHANLMIRGVVIRVVKSFR